VRGTSRAIVNADHFNVMHVKLPANISAQLAAMPESGMGYQIISVKTKNGAVFERVVVIQSELIANVAGQDKVPFDPNDIATFELTHDRSGMGSKYRA
jgi:hypothetical protein